MSTFTLTQQEIEQLEQRVQEATKLPWRYAGVQCGGPNFLPIFSFQYEQNIGPQDEIPMTVTISALSNGGSPTSLYAIGIRTSSMSNEPVLETLRLLQMVNEDR